MELEVVLEMEGGGKRKKGSQPQNLKPDQHQATLQNVPNSESQGLCCTTYF